MSEKLFSRRKVLLASFLVSIQVTIGQQIESKTDVSNINPYAKLIGDFVILCKNSTSFHNGKYVNIPKPKDDKDALTKGFKLMQTDDEQRGNWKILFATNVMLDLNKENIHRAVLYEYKHQKHIVFYREEEKNQYYFRIHSLKY